MIDRLERRINVREHLQSESCMKRDLKLAAPSDVRRLRRNEPTAPAQICKHCRGVGGEWEAVVLRQERLKLLKLHLVRVTEGGAAPSSLSLPDSGRGSEGKRRSDRSRECFHLARPVGGRLRGDKLFLSVCCATRQRRANGGGGCFFWRRLGRATV